MYSKSTVVSLRLLVKIQIVFIICNPLVFLNDLSLNIKKKKRSSVFPQREKKGNTGQIFFILLI